MELRPADGDDADAIQALIETQPGYAERVTGYPPGPADAQSLLLMRPEGRDADAKRVLVAPEDDRLVAVVDLIRGHPEPDRAFIGLLLVDGSREGSGLATRALDAATDWIRIEWPEIRTLRLGIVDANVDVAEPFWRARGFSPTGEEKPYRYDHVSSTTRLWERPLDAAR